MRRLELAGLVVACAAAATLVYAHLLRPEVYEGDAFVHQYWMWSFRDAGLFTDPLTAALRESGRYPVGYQALYWLPAQLVDPIQFGEWLGVALLAFSAVLVALIVREHGGWKPGAWIAAGLFLALLDIHRFGGGFQRAFVHPAVLLTVLLLLRGHVTRAALTVAVTTLIYPPAALLAGGVLALTAVIGRDRRRMLAAVGAAGLSGIFLLAQGGAGEVLSAAQARTIPEFGSNGTLRFFADSTRQYLSQNRSGFDLRESGGTLLVAGLALLVLVPGTWRRLRREVWAMPVVSLALWAAAQAVLFKLYLPHRYTYPLVAFLAIAIGVGLHPAWQRAVASPRRALLVSALLFAPVAAWLVARYAFPLGPLLGRPPLASAIVLGVAVCLVLAVGGGVVLRNAAAGAVISGLVLVALLVHASQGSRGSACLDTPAVQRLAELPKDAIVAGDPSDLKCIPGTARRAVVISSQLAPSYEPAYLELSRARMFAMLRAYYGSDPRAFAELADRYGADVLWVRRDAIEREMRDGGRRWRWWTKPFGAYVQELLKEGRPQTLSLPRSCQEWSGGEDAIYSVACLSRAGRSGAPADPSPSR